MTATITQRKSAASAADPEKYGPLGRLGLWTSSHARPIAVAWVLVVIALGFFATKAQGALAGAGWEASGSESVAARTIINKQFAGMSSSALQVVVHAKNGNVSSPPTAAIISRVEEVLRGNSHVGAVVAPSPGSSISADGSTAVIRAGARGDSNAMVAAAERLAKPLHALQTANVTVALTGSSALWADFNKANHSAMMKSELYSWPVTLAILVLAFGSLVAAGLPLMLTILGLAAAAGSLYLATLIGPVSIWAMNFAMMFALALGIDYALFMVARFRSAQATNGHDTRAAVAETMDTAGKAVLFSGVTVLISLSAVMLVPAPAFRSMALGIMLAVLFVLGATLTLLPAVLARLGARIDSGALPWAHSGEHRSARFQAWGEKLWRHPVRFGAAALALLLVLALPVLGLRTGMPSIKVLPANASARVGYDLVQSAFGKGAPGALQIIVPAGETKAAASVLSADAGIAGVMPAIASLDGARALIQAVPSSDPSSKQLGVTVDRLRSTLPKGALVGGAAVENHDLEVLLANKTPLVIGVVLVLGFLLLLLALQAPLMAALGVLTNLFAVAAAFGAARLIFQNGHGSGLFGFESQGFLDAWAPIFFFAMIFAISMDYTLFLLSSAKEHWDRSHDAKESMIGGLAHSGRTIFAAGAVMVAVFFTFALSGPLPPKEMGVVLGLAVLLDAALVRLILLPVLQRLAGRYAWSSPRWLSRFLPSVTFGH